MLPQRSAQTYLLLQMSAKIPVVHPPANPLLPAVHLKPMSLCATSLPRSFPRATLSHKFLQSGAGQQQTGCWRLLGLCVCDCPLLCPDALHQSDGKGVIAAPGRTVRRLVVCWMGLEFSACLQYGSVVTWGIPIDLHSEAVFNLAGNFLIDPKDYVAIQADSMKVQVVQGLLNPTITDDTIVLHQELYGAVQGNCMTNENGGCKSRIGISKHHVS
jgi:hypothetical protein